MEMLKFIFWGVFGYVLLPCFLGWTIGATKGELTYTATYNALAFLMFVIFLAIGIVIKFYLGSAK